MHYYQDVLCQQINMVKWVYKANQGESSASPNVTAIMEMISTTVE